MAYRADVAPGPGPPRYEYPPTQPLSGFTRTGTGDSQGFPSSGASPYQERVREPPNSLAGGREYARPGHGPPQDRDGRAFYSDPERGQRLASAVPQQAPRVRPPQSAEREREREHPFEKTQPLLPTMSSTAVAFHSEQLPRRDRDRDRDSRHRERGAYNREDTALPASPHPTLELTNPLPTTTPPENGIERREALTRPSATPHQREFSLRGDHGLPPPIGASGGEPPSAFPVPPPGSGPGPFTHPAQDLTVPANQDPTADYNRSYTNNPPAHPPHGTQWDPRLEQQVVGELETKLQVLQEKRDREKDAYEQHIAGLQQTLQTLSVHLENERDRNRSVKDMAEGRRQELDAINEKHKRAMTEQQIAHKRQLQKEREAMDAKLQRMNDALRDKDAEIKALKKQMDELKSWLDRGAEDFSSMFSEIQGLKDELEEAHRQLADKRATAVDERDRLEQTIDVLAHELRNTNEQLAFADQEKGDKNALLANALASSKTMEDETSGLKNRLQRTTEALHDLEVTILQIKEQADGIDAVKHKLLTLQGDLERNGLLPIATKPADDATEAEKDTEKDQGNDKVVETTDDSAGPPGLSAPVEHQVQVLLKKNNEQLNDIHNALAVVTTGIRASKEKQILVDGGGSLNPGQLAEIGRAATNTYHNAVNRDRLEGHPEPQPQLYAPAREADSIFALLLEETRRKDGDVLDELLAHLVPADEVVAFDVVAEAARVVRGNTPPYPGLNLMDLLMMRLVSMTGPDIDQLMLHAGVPSYLNQKAWDQYRDEHQRNPDILATLAQVMSKFVTDKQDAALTAVRPWLKTLGLLAALASVRTQDRDHPHGLTATQSVSTAPPRDDYPHEEGMVLLAPLHVSIGQNLAGTVTGITHGRPLQNVAQFPKEQGVVLPIGGVLQYDGGLSEHLLRKNVASTAAGGVVKGPVFNFEGRVDSLALQEWIYDARVDSEAAAKRLEEALTRRGIAEAVHAVNDRMATMEDRHAMETTLLRAKEDSLRKELDAVADTVIKTQNLASEAYAERDDALGKYAEAERKWMKKELEGDADELDSPGSVCPVAGAAQQLCEDCNSRRAEVMCTLCRARLCIVCSERIHAGGVMRSHPVRLIEVKKKRSIIDTSHMDLEAAAEVRRLEAKYEKMKEKARQLRVDWDKVEEAHLMAKQIDTEKGMLQEYIRRLEQENHGLRTLTAAPKQRNGPPGPPISAPTQPLRLQDQPPFRAS
eukprot:TRINITY_DN9679_c0_g2_i1.p1 TRINITY_DN9679_c0_g2~~TRINITY_DN9679_c0_g2_i1.p1  ORF type:complete len:1221 (+),score=460.22 TRINITY_DN9679_c0_g2_i1:49-3711(+)